MNRQQRSCVCGGHRGVNRPVSWRTPRTTLICYPHHTPRQVECKTYADVPIGPGGMGGNRQIKVMMKITAAPGFGYEYYCDHTYSPKEKSLIWTLDYERDSDFDDVTGHWCVTAQG